MKTYFVKGYGFHENGYKKEFQGLMDVENPDSDGINTTIIKWFNFSPFRSNKEIIIEQINLL